LDATPESVNSDPYGAGWMVKVKVSNTAEFDALMSAADYKSLIGH
jgi:glycine cleavage system H protein